MEMNEVFNYVETANDLLAVFLILEIGIAMPVLVVLFVIDIFQTKHAIAVTIRSLAGSVIFSSISGNFFANTFLSWIARRCPSTGNNVPGFIGRRRISTIRWPSVPCAISTRQELCCS